MRGWIVTEFKHIPTKLKSSCDFPNILIPTECTFLHASLTHSSEFVKAWIEMSTEQLARYKACCLPRYWEWFAITNIEMHFVKCAKYFIVRRMC